MKATTREFGRAAHGKALIGAMRDEVAFAGV
jgi:hypothetical protein